MAVYAFNGPTFAFCGHFAGDGSVSTTRWLKKCNHEMSSYKAANNNTIPADLYLENLSMLLTSEAATWSESYSEAIHFLAEPNPAQVTVNQFKALLCERFPSNAVELTPIPFDVELAELKQREDESLAGFYNRVTNLIQRVKTKDR